MKKRMSVWRIVCKSLGEKAGKNNQEADKIALIRLLITSQILITNVFIIFGVVRHWNDIPSNVPETKEERVLSTNSNVP
jgi:hypothetical protein